MIGIRGLVLLGVCSTAWLVLLALPGAIGQASAGEQSPPPTNNPEQGQTPVDTRWHKIEFSGNHSFSQRQLKEALLSNVDFLAAVHPFADPSELAPVAQRLLTSGYQHAGFPDATSIISASDTAFRTWNCEIHEGDRFACGSVVVDGAQQIDSAEIVSRLTNPQPPTDAMPSFRNANGTEVVSWIDREGDEVDFESPVWQPASPVRFGEEDKIRVQVVEVLSSLGYSQAKVAIEIRRDDESKTASLIVKLIDEGPEDRVSQMVCEGLSINTEEQVLGFVGLTKGDFIDSDAIRRTTKKLWESGRFTKHELSFDNTTGQLNVRLEEFPGLPAVSEPISEAAKGMLAVCKWLSSATTRGDDVQLRIRSEQLEMRLTQAVDGALVQFVTVDQQPPSQFSVLVDAKHLLIDHSSHSEKIKIPLDTVPTWLRINTEFGTTRTGERAFNLALRAKYSTDRTGNKKALEHGFATKPVGWLPFAYRDSAKLQKQNSKLILEYFEDKFVIDPQSGAMNQVKFDAIGIDVRARLYEALREDLVSRTGRLRHAG